MADSITEIFERWTVAPPTPVALTWEDLRAAKARLEIEEYWGGRDTLGPFHPNDPFLVEVLRFQTKLRRVEWKRRLHGKRRSHPVRRRR